VEINRANPAFHWGMQIIASAFDWIKDCKNKRMA